MAIKVKICGVKDIKTAQFVESQNADFLGLVFFKRSPRNISVDQAIEIKNSLSKKLKIVAVTVNPDDDFLEELKKLSPDYIQLHGSETAEDAKNIKERYGCKIIKAISVSAKEDLKKAEEFSEVVDYILFDAKPPKGAELPGGNAISFDWEILKDFSPKYKYILSGGLTPENVKTAISASGVDFVDVSSGIESSRGVKDISLIRKFISEVQKAKSTQY